MNELIEKFESIANVLGRSVRTIERHIGDVIILIQLYRREDD